MNETEELKREIEELKEALRKEQEALRKEKEAYNKIKKEFEEFKAKHAVTVSNLKDALHIKKNQKFKSKPLGAPKGHKGYSRRIPERIDYIKPHKICRCPYCNTKLGRTQEIRSRYVTDVKLTSNVEVTRHDIYRKYCTTCKKLVEPKISKVLPHARFGLNLMLLVMYLKLGLRLPGNKVCEFLKMMYNLDISESEIIGIMKQLSLAFGDYYTHLEKIIKYARVKHTDSTSWRVDGKNYFAWVFISYGVVLYKIRKRNNGKVPLTVFGTKQKGNTLVIDRHSALRTLANKSGFSLQLCWSHITDDSKNLAKNFGSEGKYVHKKLKEIFAAAKSMNHRGNPELVEQLKGEILQLTNRHYIHNTMRRFVNNLYYRDVDNLFRFVIDPGIDATNNISERELRALVIIRKISNGSRSHRGANATAMLLSVVQTLRLQKKNILQGLSEILKNTSGY